MERAALLDGLLGLLGLASVTSADLDAVGLAMFQAECKVLAARLCCVLDGTAPDGLAGIMADLDALVHQMPDPLLALAIVDVRLALDANPFEWAD